MKHLRSSISTTINYVFPIKSKYVSTDFEFNEFSRLAKLAVSICIINLEKNKATKFILPKKLLEIVASRDMAGDVVSIHHECEEEDYDVIVIFRHKQQKFPIADTKRISRKRSNYFLAKLFRESFDSILKAADPVDAMTLFESVVKRIRKDEMHNETLFE